MSAPRVHVCWPLLVAGVFRATCVAHWWRPIYDQPTPTKERAR